MTPDPSNTFFFSDPHFDHTNIIRYQHRPFATVEEMNETMLRNYCEVVKPDSTVYFLGDMAFGRGSRNAKWWLSQLPGNITYIKGSHDHGIRPTNHSNCHLSLVLDTGISKVLLIHSPWEIEARDWKGWVIHGHTHSDKLVNGYSNRVCVCVEATGYRPVSLEQLRTSIKFLS
jgi:calcineurin-like phosphoesterase family protein